MQIPGLTRSTIEENTAGGSYERGQRYYEEGAVRQIEHEVEEVKAQVQGKQALPYTVHITYDSDGIKEVECSCPYHKGTWCKHIAAVLLALLDQSEGEAEASIDELLRGVNREELIRLIERLAERDPRVIDWIEEERASS